MKKNMVLTGLVTSAVLFLAACGGGDAGGADRETLNVLTTTGMIADMARHVGGEYVTVTALMGPGVDPHLYKASAGDINRLNRADIILYNGLFLEGKMIDVLEKIGRKKATFAVGTAVDEARLLASQQYEGHPDPHVWFDVQLWSTILDDVAEQFAALIPEQAETFRSNAEAYRLRLEELHGWVVERISEIPEDQRIMITAHDAFSYFGRAYGIRVVGLQGINTQSEYGIADVNRLVELIVDSRIRAVFVESSVPRRSIEAVVEGCRQRGHEVSIGGELFSDAMGESGTPEGTYIGMVQHNVNTIADSLKGE